MKEKENAEGRRQKQKANVKVKVDSRRQKTEDRKLTLHYQTHISPIPNWIYYPELGV